MQRAHPVILEQAFAAIVRETSGSGFTAKQLAAINAENTLSAAALRRKLTNAGCTEPEYMQDLLIWLTAHSDAVAGGMTLTNIRSDTQLVWSIQTEPRRRLVNKLPAEPGGIG